MFDDYDPRDDSRDRDDGVRDREDQWLVVERGPASAPLRDHAVEHDTRHRDNYGRDGRDRAAALTERGRSLLEAHRRDRDPDHRQAFYAGADRARERTHDAQLYRAYLKEAERLREQDARILRVQLDRELKRDYQRFLQERNS